MSKAKKPPELYLAPFSDTDLVLVREYVEKAMYGKFGFQPKLSTGARLVGTFPVRELLLRLLNTVEVLKKEKS